MKKTIIYLVSVLVLASFVSAGIIDKLTNFDVNKDDGTCSGGENPLISPNDCKIGLNEVSSLKILEYAWFIKLVLIIGIFWVLSNKDLWGDKNFQLIIIIILAIIWFGGYGYFSQKPQPLNTNVSLATITTTTTTLPAGVIDLGSYSIATRFWNWFGGLGKVLWPSQPVLAWIIIVGGTIALIAFYHTIIDYVESFLNRWLWRRKR